ncbi:MAG: hypothetical protein ACOWWR_03160 [Eubacteriales bacterium]
MRPIDYAGLYSGIIFVVNFNGDMLIETEIKYLSCQSAILRILSPDEYHDCRISTPHVPSFAYPTLLGYTYKGCINQKFTESILFAIREWMRKRKDIQIHRSEIDSFVEVGIAESEIKSWLNDEYELGLSYGDNIKIFLHNNETKS